MIRIIRTWLLLRELQNVCHGGEMEHHRHGKETGHSYKAAVTEEQFLDATSEGDVGKRAVYSDLLSLAEKKMRFISTKEKNNEEGVPEKWIRLNEEGLEFVGFLDLAQYLLVKYKLVWTLLVTPIAAFFLGLFVKDFFQR